ncbi:MAG: CDP-alcohol phosphatidyltransferase family protein [Gammaproteobacteria bacterium]|nr:CDP-alcohol phosphatidyltransferase family protein [Gammaproteobacteria bacterium]
MSWRYLPNLLSVVRIALVIPTVWSLQGQRFRTALALIVLAAATDALDGFLARRFHWASRLGSVLDPLADKLMLVSVFLALGWLGHLPAWLAALVVARDAVIVAGAVAYHLLIEDLRMDPTGAGKATTAAQLALLGAVVAHLAGVPIPAWLVEGLVWLTGAVTLWSGADYVYRWARRAVAAPSNR